MMGKGRGGLGWLVVALVLGAGWAQAEVVPVEEGRALRLAERLLAGPAGYGTTLRLIPGAAPEALPLELPELAGAELLGSALREEESGYHSTQLLYDVAGPSDEVMAALGRELASRGWQARAQHTPGSFVDGAANLFSEFCPPTDAGAQEDRGGEDAALRPVVYINAFHAEEGVTDLRIEIVRYPYGPCAEASGDLVEEVLPLPPLRTPPGVDYVYLGNHWGSEEASSNARLRGDMRLGALARAYETQLETHGCVALDAPPAQAGDQARSSLWRLSDEGGRWQAVLSLVMLGEDVIATFAMTRGGTF